VALKNKVKKPIQTGLEACRHSETKDEIVTDPDSGIDFMRRTCIACGQWCGDLPPIDLGAMRAQAIERIFQPGKPPA